MYEETNASLRVEVEKLRREMDELKISLLDPDNKNTLLPSDQYRSSLFKDTGRGSTVDESKFSHDLWKSPHKTSSPLKVLHTDTISPQASTLVNEELPSCSFIYQRLRDPRRLLGEIAFQLDRRILSYIFREQPRLYGFTVQNIREKIEHVSTHPLTGKVDEMYKLQLSKRHMEIMDRLHTLGYNMALHPPFTEFIVNTCGILKELPDAYGHQESAYNNPEFLRRVIVENAPSKLLKDLLLLLSCLCFMARQDGQSLFLW